MSHDTWLHRVARTVLVRPLAGTAVTPNQLTTARLACGVGAAALVASGDPAWMNLGAGVFVLAMLLDRADGDLARSTGQTSAAGHRYDLVSDALSNALIFIGLGVGFRDGTYGAALAAGMGVAAGAAVVCILWLVVRLEALGGERAGELGAAGGFDPDDAMAVVPVVLWLGHGEWLLLAAAIGAPAFALGFFVFFVRRAARR